MSSRTHTKVHSSHYVSSNNGLEHVTAITVSDDNRYIISGSFDKSIKVFDMITHQEVFHLEKIHTSMQDIET